MGPGRVPAFYGHFWQKEIDNAEKDDDGNTKFCKICNSLKPRRAHHCGKCNSCALTLDHHCYMLGCIGFFNKKSFILTNIYGVTIMAIGITYNFFYLWDAFEDKNFGVTSM